MQKILISLMILSLTIAVAYKATKAYFSDTQTSSGNSFTAGTLILNIGDTSVAKFNVTNANPGQSGGGTWTVANAGNLTGYLDIHNITKVDDDNGCMQPETAAGDITCGSGGGELSANMNVNLFIDSNNDTIDNDGATIYSGLLSGMVEDYNYNLPLAGNGTNYIRLNWTVPATVGNIIQSDSTGLAMSFELGQTVGQ